MCTHINVANKSNNCNTYLSYTHDLTKPRTTIIRSTTNKHFFGTKFVALTILTQSHTCFDQVYVLEIAVINVCSKIMHQIMSFDIVKSPYSLHNRTTIAD